jgi:hypothetical protein
VALATKTRVEVRPIGEADVPAVASFLHAHLNQRVAPAAWARALETRWVAERPNAGFMLLDGDAIVGAHLAFYSQRTIDGRTERFCNLGAWCVLPDYRLQGLRLLRAALRQDGYHFTDLSPSGNVVAVNERLGFQFVDTTTALVPNLPWPTLPGRGRLITDPEQITRALTGAELELYRDHAATPAAHHLVLTHGDASCYVVFRRDRRKGLPLFVSVLYVSDPAVFRAMGRRFARHLLFRHGAPATLAEERITGYRPRPSLRLRSPRRRMFRSPSLAPAQIDYLYSELVCVAW